MFIAIHMMLYLPNLQFEQQILLFKINRKAKFQNYATGSTHT